MAAEALTGVVVTIDGVNYSDEISSVAAPIQKESLDSTTFASSGWNDFVPGLKGGTFTVNFKKDSDLSGLDAAMWTELTGTDSTPITIKKSSGTTTAANPQYSFSVHVEEWDPISGAVGALHEHSVSWTITGAVTRATS